MQTIGERLEEARKKKGISIREAAEATKIRGDYLQKFESNHFDIGLTEIYTRGFLRNYATFLKLPADRILNDYASLGRGDVRPRQPSREIYGRMDISVATAGESSERAAPPEEGASAEPAPGAPRAQPRYPRGSGPALPSGPDPAVVFKYVKWGGIALGVLLVALFLRAVFSGSGSSSANSPVSAPNRSPASAPPVATAPARRLTYRLIAKDIVQVRVATVTRDLGEDQNAPEVQELFNGLLRRGESKTLPLDGPERISFSAGENLSVEFNGSVFPMSASGAGSQGINIPKSMR